jgi:hypothetical protein
MMLKNNAIKLMVFVVILNSAVSTQSMATEAAQTEPIAHHIVRDYTELPGKKGTPQELRLHQNMLKLKRTNL